MSIQSETTSRMPTRSHNLRTSASQVIPASMRLFLYAARPTPHGDLSRLVRLAGVIVHRWLRQYTKKVHPKVSCCPLDTFSVDYNIRLRRMPQRYGCTSCLADLLTWDSLDRTEEIDWNIIWYYTMKNPTPNKSFLKKSIPLQKGEFSTIFGPTTASVTKHPSLSGTLSIVAPVDCH